MASCEKATKKVLGITIPLGVWIILSYEEADAFTSTMSREAIAQVLGKLGPWGAAAAAAINIQQRYIRSLNEKSDHKGVKLLFVPWTGMIMSVERRGFSMETPSGVGSHVGTGSHVGGGVGGPVGGDHRPHQQN